MTRKEGGEILDAILDLRAAVEHGFASVDERLARGFALLDDRLTGIRDELIREIRRSKNA